MKVRLPLLLAAGLAASGCATIPPVNVPVAAAPPALLAKPSATGVPLPILNPGFEETSADRPCPPAWWCTVHSDPTSFRFETLEGGPSGRFLRGERVKNEPWAMVTQTLSAKGLEGRVLRVSADIGAGAMKSGDGAGSIVRLYAPGGRVLAADKALRAPGAGWGRTTVEIMVPKGVELIDIGVVMYGDGIADFDNVAAEHFSR